MKKKPLTIVVVGASAGGLTALCEFVSHLPADGNAAIFIVLHLSKTGIGDYLVQRLRGYTDWTCVLAEENLAIQPRHVYVARMNKHMLLKDNHILLGGGPSENRWRPSIDVLFRSAAVEYRENVIGIILTGLLNDGTAGMSAIKQCGGATIVQDPNEAEFPDMPISVIEQMEVDSVASLSEIGNSITQLMTRTKKQNVEVPAIIAAESALSAKVVTGIEHVAEIGEKTLFACPDCGGGLWMVENNSNDAHYHCHIGHSYTEKDLAMVQVEAIEATLWVALRMMEERKLMLHKMAGQERNRGLKRVSDIHLKNATDLALHIDKLKEVLVITTQTSGAKDPDLKNEK